MPTWLVTGGAGFIGSNFVLAARAADAARIVNLDKLTYAGNLANLAPLGGDPGYGFVHGDICDRELVRQTLQRWRPDCVVHFAAESHVDRSILEPGTFVQTNVVGTQCLLQESLAYWEGLSRGERAAFRFLQVSTDEVFGSLEPDDPPFTELTPYSPNSPYAASKAAADHFAQQDSGFIRDTKS